MLAALTQLLLFPLVGEVIARGIKLPLPGPVVGMLLLFDGDESHTGPFTARASNGDTRFDTRREPAHWPA